MAELVQIECEQLQASRFSEASKKNRPWVRIPENLFLRQRSITTAMFTFSLGYSRESPHSLDGGRARNSRGRGGGKSVKPCWADFLFLPLFRCLNFTRHAWINAPSIVLGRLLFSTNGKAGPWSGTEAHYLRLYIGLACSFYWQILFLAFRSSCMIFCSSKCAITSASSCYWQIYF